MAGFKIENVYDWRNKDDIQPGTIVYIGDNIDNLRDQVFGEVEAIPYIIDYIDTFTFEASMLNNRDSQANHIPFVYKCETTKYSREFISPQDFLEEFLQERILLRVEGWSGEAMEVLQVKTEMDDKCIYFSDGLVLRCYSIPQLQEEGYMWYKASEKKWRDFYKEIK